MKSRVTTKRGDHGETTALSHDAHPKSHPIIECVGVVDELRAHIALVRQLLLAARPGGHDETAAFLLWLLHVHFVIGAMCSDPLRKRPEYHKGFLADEHLARLEGEQARLERGLSLPRGFVVSAHRRPGVHHITER